LQWAKEFVQKPNWWWRRVIWSDEKKFELLSNRRRVIVYRKPNQRYQLKFVKPSIKHGGGSIMIWGCFSYYGVGSLHLIDGIMDQNVYKDILIDNLQYSADLIGLADRFLLQQDLDPKDTALAARDFFAENHVAQLPWSRQSSDANPIENLWSILDLSVPSTERVNKTRFFAALQKSWYDLDKDMLKKLVESVPGRLFDIIKAKGGPTGH
jgi:hypothetical protein